MFIRRTSIKSRKDGTPYFTYRLVESVRSSSGVRQHTLLNLGRNFSVHRDSWLDLAKRISGILSGQAGLFPLSPELEKLAQHYASLVIQAQSLQEIRPASHPDMHTVDVHSIDLSRPREVSTEHVCLSAIQQLKFEEKLEELGFNGPQLKTAMGTIIGRMVEPGSELATHSWLQNRSGLGELVDYDYQKTSLTRMYTVADLLLEKKEELEKHLFNQQRNLFQLEETITLYDLTNTFFEGSGKFNDLASRGHSKEKRSDCPLVTLGLVLDGSGFPKKSKVFAGNIGEASTLKEMIIELSAHSNRDQNAAVTIVLDAGIATQDNIGWLKENDYRYIVVSRKRHREFTEDDAVTIKSNKNGTVKGQKVVNDETGEIELYCHSSLREKKERGIQDRFSSRFEEALNHLNEGLNKKRCVKKYEKIFERIGRIKQKYSKASQHYLIDIKKDEETGNATEITWELKNTQNTTYEHPGVYCLRTNHDSWDETLLWKTYTMLTDLEAVFRSLKSELGLRPVYHQKTDRVSSHLFITLLAFHFVQTIRYQLRNKDIKLSWSELRRQLKGQVRVTVSMNCENDKKLHIRKSTRPEMRQQVIYDALNINHFPGKTIKSIL